MIVHAGIQAAPTIFVKRVGRQRYDRHGLVGPRRTTNGLSRFDAIHHWHLHVHQDQVVFIVTSQRHRFGPVFRIVDAEPEIGHQ